jgi:hypothetical protein
MYSVDLKNNMEQLSRMSYSWLLAPKIGWQNGVHRGQTARMLLQKILEGCMVRRRRRVDDIVRLELLNLRECLSVLKKRCMGTIMYLSLCHSEQVHW